MDISMARESKTTVQPYLVLEREMHEVNARHGSLLNVRSQSPIPSAISWGWLGANLSKSEPRAATLPPSRFSSQDVYFVHVGSAENM